MRLRKFKIFMHFEKEEAWLNKMAQKGLHLVDYKFGRYYFDQGTPGEYIYRLEMLDTWPNDEKSKEYIEFMADSNVELVTTYNTWIYFRKKAESEPFEIYTDIPSRIKHYEKIARVFGVVSLINIVIALFNLNISKFNMFFSFVNFFVGILLLIPLITLISKIKNLKRENEFFDK